MKRLLRWLPAVTEGWLVAGIAVSICLLSWFGYHAIQEWRQSSILVGERRANEAADLLLEALTRDMRGAQESILTSPEWEHFSSARPYEMSTLVESAFARYPYPESFFAWAPDPTPSQFWFFNRADKRPAWMASAVGRSRFPVVIEQESDVAGQLTARIVKDATVGRRYSIFETTIKGVPYQIVSQLMYSDAFRDRLAGAVGFTVNLPWAQTHYVAELANQVWAIDTGTEKGLTLSVTDERGRQVAGSPIESIGPTNRRNFALTFFDPDVAIDSADGVTRNQWTVAVSAANDPTLSQAIRGANRTMLIGVTSAFILGFGLILTARAERSRARLAEMRSDFVSTVTHELKTPIATIKAAAETLAHGRLRGLDEFQAYGEMVVIEAKRLTRLVENLLAYSRITDVADVYAFEALDISALLRDIHGEFETQLDEAGFDVQISIPAEAPPIRGDRLALRLLFSNLIDNAIRYSTTSRHLWLRAYAEGPSVTIDVADSGIGIPADEVGSITRKFVRGRRVSSAGSGLGLAITARITRDHGGHMKIHSLEGSGTTVSVTLPAA